MRTRPMLCRYRTARSPCAAPPTKRGSHATLAQVRVIEKDGLAPVSPPLDTYSHAIRCTASSCVAEMTDASVSSVIEMLPMWRPIPGNGSVSQRTGSPNTKCAGEQAKDALV